MDMSITDLVTSEGIIVEIKKNILSINQTKLPNTQGMFYEFMYDVGRKMEIPETQDADLEHPALETAALLYFRAVDSVSNSWLELRKKGFNPKSPEPFRKEYLGMIPVLKERAIVAADHFYEGLGDYIAVIKDREDFSLFPRAV
jgi:hypothetical protein